MSHRAFFLFFHPHHGFTHTQVFRERRYFKSKTQPMNYLNAVYHLFQYFNTNYPILSPFDWLGIPDMVVIGLLFTLQQPLGTYAFTHAAPTPIALFWPLE